VNRKEISSRDQRHQEINPEATDEVGGHSLQTQQEISQKIQKQFLGRRLKVLIDEKQKNETDIYLGRSEFDAPEVDGVVYVHSQKILKPGDFAEIEVTDTLEYDLAGELR